MALRLRRGTDAERLLITPVEGELIYTTDTKLLYAGDGATAGGNLVAGGGGGSTTLDALTDTDLTGVENNQVLTYLSGTNKWEPTTLPGVGALALNDLTNVNTGGVATWDVLQYDGVNFVPKSIDEALATDNDGSIAINTVGIHTGNVVGSVDGDVTGSIFGDDSTLIVDGVNNQVNTNQINSSADASIVLQNDFRTPVQIKAVTDGNPGGFPYTDYLSIKGTFNNPLPIAANDIVGGWKISAWDISSQQGKATTVMASRLMADAVITDTTPNSLTSMLVSGGGTNTSSFDFYGNGQFKSPGAITPGVYADNTARDAAIPTPTAGMMVFNTTGTKFQGYTGSAWVDLN